MFDLNPFHKTLREKFIGFFVDIIKNKNSRNHFLSVLTIIFLFLSIFIGIFIGLLQNQNGNPISKETLALITKGDEVSLSILIQIAMALALTVVVSFVGIMIYSHIRKKNNLEL